MSPRIPGLYPPLTAGTKYPTHRQDKHDINRQQIPLFVNDPYHPASRACRRKELDLHIAMPRGRERER
jgi:hypothetical protein